MAASVIERYDSRQLSGRTLTYRYTVVGTDDLDEVLNVLANEAPEQLANGFPRGEPSANPLGGGMWECEIPYSASGNQIANDMGADPGPTPPPDGGGEGAGRGSVAGGANGSDPMDTGIRFGTGGGTIRITQAVKHISSHAAPGNVPFNHKGAINVQPDGTAEGVEVYSAAAKFQISKRIPNLTKGFYQLATSMTATVNKTDWKGFGKREVLLEGVEGNWENGAWAMTWHFAYMPSYWIENIDNWVPFYKAGWDYLWFEYIFADDAAAVPKQLGKRPIAAHIEQVYEHSDFDIILL